MALTDKALQKINADLANYNHRVTEIRKDSHLSDEGRRALLAETYATTKARLDAYRAESVQDITRRQTELQRSLFGFNGMPSSPTAAASLRDAQDRVSAAKTPEALAELMEQASITGDQDILKAGFAHAWKRSHAEPVADEWVAIVDEYCAQHPANIEKRQELDQLVEAQSPRASVMDGLATALQPPTELSQRGPAPYAEHVQHWS